MLTPPVLFAGKALRIRSIVSVSSERVVDGGVQKFSAQLGITDAYASKLVMPYQDECNISPCSGGETLLAHAGCPGEPHRLCGIAPARQRVEVEECEHAQNLRSLIAEGSSASPTIKPNRTPPFRTACCCAMPSGLGNARDFWQLPLGV